MPRTNTAFWTKKFSENIERDRKALRGLEHLAWRVMVVWECELVSETVQTVEKVATWLREGMNSTGGATYEYPMADRSTLLTVAEEKVRYRIASYKENRDATDPGEGET